VQSLENHERLMFYDEFSISEQNSYYGWAKRNTRPKVKSNERHRRRVNGMLAIDILSAEEYLWVNSHAQSDDVARYMAHLAADSLQEGYHKLEVVLDHNTTHKEKMKRIFKQECLQLGIDNKIEVIFSYLPVYSPKLNIAEYAIHLLRQRCLHHRPYGMTLEEIQQVLGEELASRTILSQKQIANLLHHIENLVDKSINLTG